MDFRKVRVPYEGREKYPSNGNGTAIRGIIQNYFGGGGMAIQGGSNATPGDYDNNRGKNASSFFALLSKSSNVFDKTSLPFTDILQVYGYKDMEAAQVLIGDISTSAESATWSITGIPVGMNVQVTDNGTRDTSISFMATTAITETEGDIKIPVAIYINENNIDPSHYTFWFYRQNCMVMTLTYHWSVIDPSGGGEPGESAWYLSLDNDNASINADSDGNIYPGAVRPTCHSKLFYGMNQDTGATYSIDYGSATGVSISTSQGVGTLNFAQNFNFSGDNLAIIVSGMSGGELRDVKVMNVTKSIAGTNGESSTSYWLDINYGDIIFDQNTKTVSPDSLSATAYMQVGEQPITAATGTTIKYCFQYRSSGSFTPETAYTQPITITSADCNTYVRVRFILYLGQNQVDLEDVNILKNGVDGEGQVKAGPAIRGPYDYYAHSADTRDWCNGMSSSTVSDSEKWIDVVMKDGTYYYCSTAYHGTPLGSNIGNWTAGESFDFIATNLLLASAASINFLTGNEIYLRDSNGNITAGLAGGDGVNFWAGAPDPVNAPFTIANDGTMKATQGMFQGTVSAATIYASDIILDNNSLKLFSSSANTFEISDTDIEVNAVPQSVTMTGLNLDINQTAEQTILEISYDYFQATGNSTVVIPVVSIDSNLQARDDGHGTMTYEYGNMTVEVHSFIMLPSQWEQFSEDGFEIIPSGVPTSSASTLLHVGASTGHVNSDITLGFGEMGRATEYEFQCTDGQGYIVGYTIKQTFAPEDSSIPTSDFTGTTTSDTISFTNAPESSDIQFFNIGNNGMQIFLEGGFYFTAAYDKRNHRPIIAMGGKKSDGQMIGLKLDPSGIKVLRGIAGIGWQDL